MVTLFSWRRRGDSNSRFRSPQTNDLANRPLQPLGYSSVPQYCNTEQGPNLDSRPDFYYTGSMHLLAPLFDVVSSLGFSLSIVDGASSARGTDQAADLFGVSGVFATLSNTMLFVVGALSVIMIIIGGLRYVISGGDSANITTAKNTILYSVVGLVVSMLAYAVINFVISSFTVGEL